jgi:large subunit ribosomal protein L25
MVVREIPVSCLPADIPSFVEVDSSSLELGDSIRIQDVKLPENVTVGTDENFAVISIVGRAKEEEELIVDAAEAVEGEEAGSEDSVKDEKTEEE